MRLRLRKVWANHHPILGETYTQRDGGITSGPNSASLSSGDLDDAPKIDPTNLYLEYSTCPVSAVELELIVFFYRYFTAID